MSGNFARSSFGNEYKFRSGTLDLAELIPSCAHTGNFVFVGADLCVRPHGRRTCRYDPTKPKLFLLLWTQLGIRQQCPVRKLHEGVLPPSPQPSPPEAGGEGWGEGGVLVTIRH